MFCCFNVCFAGCLGFGWVLFACLFGYLLLLVYGGLDVVICFVYCVVLECFCLLTCVYDCFGVVFDVCCFCLVICVFECGALLIVLFIYGDTLAICLGV